MKKTHIQIRLVDGAKIRAKHVEFVAGGHHRRYPWIPAGQIWVEENLKGCDLDATIVHEVTETQAMSHGMSYDDAHRLANSTERLYRRRVCSTKGR